MSRHKEKDGPELEEALALHGLPHDKPSQLADAFRCGWNRSGDALSALQEQNKVMREAAQAVCDAAFTTYKARNGRMCSIEADDGEACEIVHSDAMHQLRAVIAATKQEGG